MIYAAHGFIKCEDCDRKEKTRLISYSGGYWAEPEPGEHLAKGWTQTNFDGSNEYLHYCPEHS